MPLVPPLLVVLVLGAPMLVAPSAGPAADAVGPAERAVVVFDGAPPERIDGARVLHRFETLPALHVEARPDALRALARAPEVLAVHPDAPVALDLETATVAARARELWDPALTPATPVARDAEGALLDGRGVGIAVVDDGFDGTHPDLRHARIFDIRDGGVQPATYTAPTSPHGTHVAGAAAGSGAASGGRHVGAAPGAGLYAFSIGSPPSLARASIAFDWILAHGAQQDPPIRVVTNSWHCNGCAAGGVEPLHVTLVRRLTDAGVVVLFSAGNGAGDGFAPRTTYESTLQVPGVVGVANYDDYDTGTRLACVHGMSSRGSTFAPETWPDLAAPGTTIMAPWAVHAAAETREPLTGRNTYRQMTGTSMATPLVAGVVALMLQANPALAPAEVEYLLKSTATKLDCGHAYHASDPMHTYDGANHVEGHGLVDAAGAVAAAMSFDGIPPAPAPEPLPPRLLPDEEGVAVDRKLYLAADGALVDARPSRSAAPGAVPLVAETPTAFLSPPLGAPLNLSGVEVDLWVGLAAEAVYTRVPTVELRVVVERVAATGAVERLAEARAPTLPVPTGSPTPRELVVVLPEAVQLEATDRVRLLVEALAAPLLGAARTEPFANGVLYVGSAATPSRLELGHRVAPVLPDTPLACQARGQHDCARLDEERPRGVVRCSSDYLYRLVWSGPGGSSATVVCSNAVASCEISPELVWGTCEAVSMLSGRLTTGTMVCSYRAPDGAPAGSGWCERWSKVPFRG